MFGGTVLVPILTGFSPSICIMCSGIGTFLYLLITRGKIPCYLGPSFAVVTPVVIAAASGTHAEVLSGVVATGLIMMLIAFIIGKVGYRWIERIFPSYLVSVFVIVISLSLAGSAVDMVFLVDGAPADSSNLAIAAVVLCTAVVASCFKRSFVSAVAVLLAVIVGYLLSLAMGKVDYSEVVQAAWIGLPELTFPSFSLSAIFTVAPIAFVLVIDHIGHLFVVGNVVGKNYMSIFHRSLMGDGVATMVSGFLGGLPTSTFAENMGVMSLTKVYATQVYWYAAGGALIIGGLCPKIGALISTIPDPVIGAVSIIVFGFIATNGLKTLTESVDRESLDRIVLIIAPPLIVGVGMSALDLVLPVFGYQMPPLAVAMILGVALNLLIRHLPGQSCNDGAARTPQ